MTYNDLIEHLVKATGNDAETIRSIIKALPDALMQMEEADQVRTPLGVFSMKKKNPKKIRVFGGGWTTIPEETSVRLKPGKSLKKS
jgi:nucleoid DNA-binding protein